MGLDVLDLTFRIEKAFQVSISRDDLEGLVRSGDVAVGDLYDLLLKKLDLRDVGRRDFALNARLWSEMQATIHSVTAVPLADIQLKLPLESLFPRADRRGGWNALRDSCRYRIPDLDYPLVVRQLALLVTTAVVMIEVKNIWQIPAAKWFWPLLGFLGCWAFSETYLKVLSIFAPLRYRFPARLRTVKDLCRAVLAANYADICDDEVPVNQGAALVWEQLVEILCDVLGVERDQVTFRTGLVRDLGMA